jgi:hypothetical protein
MLSLQKQSKFIKKAIQLPNGSWVLVVFELVEVNGKTVAKAVYGKLIEKDIPAQEEVIALPIIFVKENFIPITSPFFADTLSLIKDLSFVVSQPSRAPNKQ